jgi:DNA-binding NarL/FixJ family response regulator
VDPHPLWLDAVASALGAYGVEVVARCTAAEEALVLVQEHRPDLVVTEIGDPDIDGYLGRIRTANPSSRVIVLTAVEDLAAVETALAAGAAAYVMKTALPDDFAAAVRQAFSRSLFLPGSANGATPNDAGVLDTPERRRAPSLTHREREILRLVAEGASNAAVAKTLWVTEQTVKFHLSNVYKKVGAANRTEAAHWARRNGVLGEEPAARR